MRLVAACPAPVEFAPVHGLGAAVHERHEADELGVGDPRLEALLGRQAALVHRAVEPLQLPAPDLAVAQLEVLGPIQQGVEGQAPALEVDRIEERHVHSSLLADQLIVDPGVEHKDQLHRSRIVALLLDQPSQVVRLQIDVSSHLQVLPADGRLPLRVRDASGRLDEFPSPLRVVVKWPQRELQRRDARRVRRAAAGRRAGVAAIVAVEVARPLLCPPPRTAGDGGAGTATRQRASGKVACEGAEIQSVVLHLRDIIDIMVAQGVVAMASIRRHCRP
mmetsp:Transcript_126517/g.354261  ORF Transcript_126517/g.354261 Transcript_126517/m.354261 type:complete len:277 (-) Transcript_126517:47-877(-)